MCYTAIHSIDAGVYVLVAAAPALQTPSPTSIKS